MLSRPTVALAIALSSGTGAIAPGPITVTSPDGKVAITVSEDRGRLLWSATMDGAALVEPSPLGIVLDDTDIGVGAVLGSVDRYRVDERYPWRGVHAVAINRSNGARISAVHEGTKTRFVVEVRAADDAVAFRIAVPGTGTRVPDAASAFRIPRGSVVWSHGLRDHYESQYDRRLIEEIRNGEWAAPPVTFRLPESRGYGSIMEADLRNYAGMALQADGRGLLVERLGHSHPPGYPYTLRYGEENARRLAAAAAIDGPIVTPWRVVVTGRDLNTLVNSDAIHNLSEPPDRQLFPQGIDTPWLKPGRAVWRYLDGGENTPAGIKEFSRLASELGFEYQVVEGQWARWSEAELRDVLDYSKERGVGIWVWRHRNTLGDAAKRRALFGMLQKIGVVGVKVDFLDHEAKEVIDLYQAILRDAAGHELMIDFHGANKPAGESRTWPNEMTREGIYGLEHRRIEAWATFNSTFPFVRMLAGHADYTPVVFGERRRETSWAHQIASAAILTSPVLIYGGHPASFLSNPAVEIIRSIPSVWDETIVLPPSEIGELAMFARRSGDRWFVAAMNGPVGRTVKINLSFLTAASYRALVAKDKPDDGGAIEIETRDVRKGQGLEMTMRPGGGFVMRLMKP